MLQETIITQAVVESFIAKFTNHIENDVVIVGGGPSGLVLGYYLAKAGIKTAIFEKKLSPGGGIWGGGMLMNQVVLQDDCMHIAEEFSFRLKKFREGYYTVDAVEMSSKLIAQTLDAGCVLFNTVEIEDIVVKDNRVGGVVINWTPVNMAKLPVDPLMIKSRFVADSTGHPSAVVSLLARRGMIAQPKGEDPMFCDSGEKMAVVNTKEVYPGLYVTGMAACGYFGSPRMGPIFGGMLLSGEKCAGEIIQQIKTDS